MIEEKNPSISTLNTRLTTMETDMKWMKGILRIVGVLSATTLLGVLIQLLG